MTTTTTLQFTQSDLCAAKWADVRRALLSAIDRGLDVVVDLRSVRYLVSGVLNALVEARVQARARGGRVVIVADDAGARRFLALVGFDKLFAVVDDEEQAEAVLQAVEA